MGTLADQQTAPEREMCRGVGATRIKVDTIGLPRIPTDQGPRCSIFQELAGDYCVDDVEEEIEQTRQENNKSIDTLSYHDSILDKQAGSCRSFLSLSDSLCFSQERIPESMTLDHYIDPVGWNGRTNNLSDLFAISSHPDNDLVDYESNQCSPRSSVTSSTSASTNATSSSSSSSSRSSSPQKSIYSGKSPSKSAHLMKSITLAPCKAYCTLFRRNFTKFSPLGISNYDEPVRYLEMA